MDNTSQIAMTASDFDILELLTGVPSIYTYIIKIDIPPKYSVKVPVKTWIPPPPPY